MVSHFHSRVNQVPICLNMRRIYEAGNGWSSRSGVRQTAPDEGRLHLVGACLPGMRCRACLTQGAQVEEAGSLSQHESSVYTNINNRRSEERSEGKLAR